ncbi:hypothetical protein V2G26_008761 [Clonostachys chloroleuca]
MEQQQGTRLKKPSPATASWSRASTRLGLRLKPPRPTISAPIGPVRTSRGEDFSRSETLTIVSEIQDCAAPRPVPPLTSNLPVPTKPSRKILTSLSTQSLTSKPTVAQSKVTATIGIYAPVKKVSINKLREASSIGLGPRPAHVTTRLPKSSTTSVLFNPDTSIQDENVPPTGDNSTKQSTTTLPGVSTPRSRTMTVLQELKSSITRPSANAKETPSIPPESFISGSSDSFGTPSSCSNLHLPTTQSPISSTPSPCDSSRSSAEPGCSQINGAKPSQFWTGRFVSLHDKLSSEKLDAGTLHSLAATYKQGTHNSLSISSQFGVKSCASNRPNRIPHSTTTSALPSLASALSSRLDVKSDEVRIQRIFQELESQCATQEAKESLHHWQHDYARRNKRPDLLPQGYKKDGSRIIEKLFGNRHTGELNGGRRSLSALRDAANSRLGRIPRQEKSGLGARTEILREC